MEEVLFRKEIFYYDKKNKKWVNLTFFPLIDQGMRKEVEIKKEIVFKDYDKLLNFLKKNNLIFEEKEKFFKKRTHVTIKDSPLDHIFKSFDIYKERMTEEYFKIETFLL